MGCQLSCFNNSVSAPSHCRQEDEVVRRYQTKSPWEPIAGYTRALRAGKTINVSGTVAVGRDGTAVKGAYEQAKRCFEIVVEAVEALGGSARHVVRTRMYVRNISKNLDNFARAHREAFGRYPPTSTMVEVSALVDEAYLIEVEAEAYVVN